MYVSYHIDSNMMRVYKVKVYSFQKSRNLNDQDQKVYIAKHWSNQEKPSNQILSSLDWLIKLYRVRISDPRIVICGSALLFCEIPKSKRSLCQNLCLQENPQASVYTSSSTICLYLTPKTVKLYTFFFHLHRNLVPNVQWVDLTAQRSPILPSYQKYSLTFRGLLLKR